MGMDSDSQRASFFNTESFRVPAHGPNSARATFSLRTGVAEKGCQRGLRQWVPEEASRTPSSWDQQGREAPGHSAHPGKIHCWLLRPSWELSPPYGVRPHSRGPIPVPRVQGTPAAPRSSEAAGAQHGGRGGRAARHPLHGRRAPNGSAAWV